MKTIRNLLLMLILVFFTSAIYAQVSTFPYHESFETGLGSWQQYTGDNFNWTRYQGATPSALTGPNAAFDGNWYVYTEANGNNNNVAILYAVFNFQSAGLTNPRFTFNYHMYNGLIFPPFIPDQMGTLEVVVSTNGGVTTQSVWQKTGNQGNSWYSAFVDLTPYASYNNVFVGFRGTVGNGNRSDIAVDEINVYQPVFNCVAIPYLQNFNASSSLPNLWTRDNPSIWVISTAWNGTNPPSGNHLNTTITTKKTGNVYSPCFDVISNVNIHVRFFHYWRRATGLAVNQTGKFYGSPDGGVTKYTIAQWSTTASEEGWKEYDISSWADGATKLLFWWEISGGYTLFGTSGYWQIDNFEVKEGAWTGIYTWTGAVSSDWNTAGNWSSGLIPNENIDVIIPSGVPHYPVINGVLYIGANYGTEKCRSLTIENNAQLSVTGWGEISLFGKVYVKTNASLNVERILEGWNGELYILGGNVTAIDQVQFLEGSGYMNSGTFTINNADFQNTGWYASGGTIFVDASSANDVNFNVVGSLNIYHLEVTMGTKVIYNGSTNVSGNFTIRPTGKFDLASGALNVSGNNYFKADATGMGQFIDHGTFNATGTTTVEEYLTSMRWHYVSTPISNAQIGVYYHIYLREFLEPTNSWNNLILPVTIPMNVTQGYSAWADNYWTGTTTVSYTGNLNPGNDYPITSLSYTPSSPGVGWNLLGNPYPAPLQWNNSWTRTNLSDWACIRNNDHDECYNAATQTGWPNAGDMPNGIIPSTQGFFVRATAAGATLTIPQSQRTFSDQAFYKSATVAVNESIRLRVDGNGDYDVALIQFIPDATAGFDVNLDLEKRWGYEEAPQLYSIVNETEPFSVNALPELKTGMIIPLGLKVGASATYTITATQIANFDENVVVVLEDILENTFTELSENSIYSFEANPYENTHRFNIHFKDSYIGSDDQYPSNIRIYADMDIIYIQNPAAEKGSVTVYNLMGQEITGQQFVGDPLVKVRVMAESGYYVVKVLTDSEFYTEKVFIK